jgi:hypothetical protein
MNHFKGYIEDKEGNLTTKPFVNDCLTYVLTDAYTSLNVGQI